MQFVISFSIHDVIPSVVFYSFDVLFFDSMVDWLFSSLICSSFDVQIELV